MQNYNIYPGVYPGDLFEVGEFYPPPYHAERVQRYRNNKLLFKGEFLDVFNRLDPSLQARFRKSTFLSINLASIVAKKSADFLFGETPTVSAGKEDNSAEQEALDRLISDNDLNIINYESALSNAYRGDSFYKVRWGQTYGGQLPKEMDPFRVIIENQNPEYVFPETVQGDANKVIAYHVAYPVMPDPLNPEYWELHVESHYPGTICYRRFEIRPTTQTAKGVEQWVISNELTPLRADQETNVPFPLIVHVPNYATDENWEGVGDLDEHYDILRELSNRYSLLAEILDKHSDPAIAVPLGTLEEDESGVPQFRVGMDKVFEVDGKDDFIPQYIVWNGQVENNFKEIERLTELFFTLNEIPMVALGGGDSGTSGSSGLSIKFRMSSLISKVNRKRQYYEKGLKRVFIMAQMLETKMDPSKKYEMTIPKIIFKDGLPNDDFEQATIMSTRLGGLPTISQKSALMQLDGLTEEQAEKELERMKGDQEASSPAPVDGTVFNKEEPASPLSKALDKKAKETEEVEEAELQATQAVESE